MDKKERAIVIKEMAAIVEQLQKINYKGIDSEMLLYETITRLQSKAYYLRNSMWEEWKRSGHLETYYPKLTKERNG